jgi:hypothetical protein
MFLRVGLRGQEPEDHELTGPGGQIRVGVGREGYRSSVWAVFANSSSSDVYVTARTIAGVEKYSLHASGDWRHQWVSREAARQYGGTDERIKQRWPRPEAAENGWTKGLSIWVPHGHLQEMPLPDTQPAITHWLREAPEGKMTGIHVAIVRPDLGDLENSDAVPFDAFYLANGEAVVVLWSESDIHADLATHMRNTIDQMGEPLAAVMTEAPPGLRMGLHVTEDASGHRNLFDLALTADPSTLEAKK